MAAAAAEREAGEAAAAAPGPARGCPGAPRAPPTPGPGLKVSPPRRAAPPLRLPTNFILRVAGGGVGGRLLRVPAVPGGGRGRAERAAAEEVGDPGRPGGQPAATRGALLEPGRAGVGAPRAGDLLKALAGWRGPHGLPLGSLVSLPLPRRPSLSPRGHFPNWTELWGVIGGVRLGGREAAGWAPGPGDRRGSPCRRADPTDPAVVPPPPELRTC